MTKLLAFTSNWGCCLDAWNIKNITELVKFCVDPPRGACGPGFPNVSVTIYLSCLIYFTWSFRNEMAHAGRKRLEEFVKLLMEFQIS